MAFQVPVRVLAAARPSVPAALLVAIASSTAVFTAPWDCQLVRVSHVNSTTNQGKIDIGTTSDDDAYLDDQTIGELDVPVLENTPWRESDFLYGAETILTTHRIPWAAFAPGSPGFPEGADYGLSLSALEDGQYIIFVADYSYYDPETGESGYDCRVQDSRHAILLTKQGDQITVQPAGAVSGFIYDGAGSPLAGIAVEINGVGTGFHERVCSRENGYYLFTRLPLDSFTLSAGGFGTEDCPENSFATLTQPDLALDAASSIVEGMDLVLGP